MAETMAWRLLKFVVLAMFSLPACYNPASQPAEKPASQSKPDAAGDADQDGLPNGAELVTENDRANFRAWFTGIAERQFYEMSREWNAEQRDCAGLVRFAWREALRTHDRAWFQKMGSGYSALAPDVGAYSLDKGILGEKLFRAREGVFQTDDLTNGAFSEFADAATLKQHNAVFVSRDPKQARPGDLLFYFQPFTQKYPYHLMIFLGGDDGVVYHTGGSAADKGEVRKARLSVLAKHPNPRWRPLENNKHFLGFYRLKILQ
jgi:hypothetical protein